MTDPLDAYLAARRTIADAREQEGFTLLRCDAHPTGYELNQVVTRGGDLERAISIAGELLPDRNHRYVTLLDPDPPPPPPPGWTRTVDLLMTRRRGQAPLARARRVGSEVVRAARERAWGEHAELVEMQEAFGRLPNAFVLAIVEAGQVLAWCQLIDGEIDGVEVIPERRGEGLGRALMEDAIAAGGWWLLADADDPRPQGLYRSLGFRDAGRIAHYTWTP